MRAGHGYRLVAKALPRCFYRLKIVKTSDGQRDYWLKLAFVALMRRHAESSAAARLTISRLNDHQRRLIRMNLLQLVRYAQDNDVKWANMSSRDLLDWSAVVEGSAADRIKHLDFVREYVRAVRGEDLRQDFLFRRYSYRLEHEARRVIERPDAVESLARLMLESRVARLRDVRDAAIIILIMGLQEFVWVAWRKTGRLRKRWKA
jgi:hypothetical protein